MSLAIRQIPVVPVEQVIQLQRRKVARISIMAAAVVMLSAFIMWQTMAPKTVATQASFEVVPGSAIALTGSDGKLLSTELRSLEAGSSIRLEHGAIEVSLPHQVRAMLEAPSSLTLVDDRTVALNSGRAFFEVPNPEGHSFTVVTPQQKIVDLGTAFGVDIRGEGRHVDLHVYQGSVQVAGLNDSSRGEIIKAPRSVALNGMKVAKELPANSGIFLKQLPERLQTVFVEDFETGLLADTDYEIRMDPTVVRNENGEYLSGMPVDEPWKFSTNKELIIRNPSFEAEQVDKGQFITGWPDITRTNDLFNTTSAGESRATDGVLFLQIVAGRTLAQNLGVSLTAGSIYTLVLDIRNGMNHTPGEALVRFLGSEHGLSSPLAELRVAPEKGTWARNQIQTFTATDEQATGQTLLIALSATKEKVSFDHLRIFEVPPVALATGGVAGNREPDEQSALQVSSFRPSPGFTHASLARIPQLSFRQPITVGSGRILLTNLTDGSEQVVFTSSDRLEITNRQLQVRPILKLEEGAEQTGGIPGWQNQGAISRFNPDGLSGRYHHENLVDHEKSRGQIDSMKGPLMARLSQHDSTASIETSINPMTQDGTYTVSVGVGSTSNPEGFAGYSIQLLSGSAVLQEISSLSPPGPANSVESVGFSWNSRDLPEGCSPQTLLTLRISTASASDSTGHLDIDHVQVTFMDDPI